jgi:hypothetical protein
MDLNPEKQRIPETHYENMKLTRPDLKRRICLRHATLSCIEVLAESESESTGSPGAPAECLRALTVP